MAYIAYTSSTQLKTFLQNKIEAPICQNCQINSEKQNLNFPLFLFIQLNLQQMLYFNYLVALLVGVSSSGIHSRP